MNRHKNRGFTLVEVIVAVGVLGIFIACLSEIAMISTTISLRGSVLDGQYNLARAICERFRNEKLEMEERTVAVFVDDADDLGLSLADVVRFGLAPAPGKEGMEALRGLNVENRKYICVLRCSRQEYMDMLEVKVVSTSAADWQRAAELMIARPRISNES